MKELETLRVSPGHRASLNMSEGERESVKWGVLDNPPPRPTYHLSSSPWKVRQSHQGILQPVSLMYGCESWTVKKAERRRIDAFETVVL